MPKAKRAKPPTHHGSRPLISKGIICFGEVLWDFLPRGLFPGGAPINVAYHLRQHGLKAIPVTAVGEDVLGHELLRRLTTWSLDTLFVARLPKKPTGTVQVQLDGRGSPSFEIVADVAWDFIPVPAALLRKAGDCAAIIFGSLAQRSAHNRMQLAALLKAAPGAHKIFDVNLRAPFNSPEIVWSLAKESTLLKLNQDELAFLLNQKVMPRYLEKAARFLSQKTGCAQIC